MRNHEDTKDTEEHEDIHLPAIHSPVPEEVDHLAHDVIGACITVHRALGPGLVEMIYERAVALELTARRIPFELEKAVPVRYRGELLCYQRLDLLVAGKLVVELKAVVRLDPIHMAQVLSYMRIADVRLGLLVNFNVPILKYGIRRVIL